MGKTSEKIELSERDLMLNDWVFDRFSNSFKQIRSTFDMDEAPLYSPIEVTKEILFENGFVKNIILNRLEYSMETIEEEIHITASFNLDDLCWIRIETYDVDTLKTKCNLLIQRRIYVHELQKALRLCERKDIADTLKLNTQ